MSTDKVFFVTGTSNGVGLILVQNLIKNGYKVAALTRRPEELEKEVTAGDLKNLLILKSDITNEENVKETITKTIEKFGRIDVVVNNAGYALMGSVEEMSSEEIQSLYQVNVFGLLSVIKYTVPILRQQKSGLIINIGSLLSHSTMGLPKYSAYISSKHAVKAISISVDDECKQFGIRSVLLSPGGIRTNFLKTGLQVTKNLIPEYQTQQLADYFNSLIGQEEGDPEKISKVIIDITSQELTSLPNNIFLGVSTLAYVNKDMEKTHENIEAYKDISLSTDFTK